MMSLWEVKMQKCPIKALVTENNLGKAKLILSSGFVVCVSL
jgi:hypothetical protein